MAVFKATSTLVMLFEADTAEEAAEILACMGVGDIAYAIENGDACGMMKDEHLAEVPTEQIKDELLAVGNDGTFFSVDSEKE